MDETQTVSLTPPSIEWVKTYGQEGNDTSLAILATGDGGFIIGGGTETPVTHLDHSWVKKIDKSGNTLWTEHTNPRILDDAHSITPSSDGGFVISGGTEPYGEEGPEDAAVIKVNENGKLIWNTSMKINQDETAYSVIETSKGEYFFVGHTYAPGTSTINAFIGLIDKNGKVLWNKRLENTNPTDAQSLIKTSDGGYLIVGYKDVSGKGNYDAWVAKLNSQGAIQWEKTYGGELRDAAHKVIQSSDGSYVIVGETNSQGAGSSDVWLFSIDPTGKLLWEKTYGGKNDDKGYSLTQTGDGGYLVAATTTSYGAGSIDAWLVKTMPDGKAQWSKTVGGVKEDLASSVIEIQNGDYVMTGMTRTYGSGEYDAWVVELE